MSATAICLKTWGAPSVTSAVPWIFRCRSRCRSSAIRRARACSACMRFMPKCPKTAPPTACRRHWARNTTSGPGSVASVRRSLISESGGRPPPPASRPWRRRSSCELASRCAGVWARSLSEGASRGCGPSSSAAWCNKCHVAPAARDAFEGVYSREVARRRYSSSPSPKLSASVAKAMCAQASSSRSPSSLARRAHRWSVPESTVPSSSPGSGGPSFSARASAAAQSMCLSQARQNVTHAWSCRCCATRMASSRATDASAAWPKRKWMTARLSAAYCTTPRAFFSSLGDMGPPGDRA
mmetsp:Transcript_24587/g.73805  ORF Transcript_24587/g.73805 Transcript_24587/m.73805 type:complete len:297 (+) Transcript_24587:246-1136(+)